MQEVPKDALEGKKAQTKYMKSAPAVKESTEIADLIAEAEAENLDDILNENSSQNTDIIDLDEARMAAASNLPNQSPYRLKR